MVLEESFSGIKVIKAFANELREELKFNKENTTLTRLIIRRILYSEGSSRIMDFIAAIAGGTVLWVGGTRVINGQMSPGELTAFLVCLVQLYDPIKKLNASNHQIQEAWLVRNAFSTSWTPQTSSRSKTAPSISRAISRNSHSKMSASLIPTHRNRR